MKPIKVLLADDHKLLREGLRVLLELKGEIEVIGEVSDGAQAVDIARELHPDVIVMDLAMPKLNGLEAARRIFHEESTSNIKVLILSAHSDDIFLEELAKIGVQGYLVKKNSADLLSKAIKEIYRGKNFYAPEIGKRFQEYQDLYETTLHNHSNKKQCNICLTTREREVLQLIAEGRSNKEIASDLYISIKTVEKHRQSIMKKLNIHDVAGLTRYAISGGIIDICPANHIIT